MFVYYFLGGVAFGELGLYVLFVLVVALQLQGIDHFSDTFISCSSFFGCVYH
jgi:hypothetical protein